jgi:hypothetical protein
MHMMEPFLSICRIHCFRVCTLHLQLQLHFTCLLVNNALIAADLASCWANSYLIVPPMVCMVSSSAHAYHFLVSSLHLAGHLRIMLQCDAYLDIHDTNITRGVKFYLQSTF